MSFNFNYHPDLVGRHAFLSASKHHWVRYDDEKMEQVFKTTEAARKGAEMHDLAADLIRLKVRLPRTPKTINMYVNDAIGFRMKPEQVLSYSPNAFGTADAIGYRDGILRIHDLKTGTTRASMEQLWVYMAFFCLEYGFKPFELQAELRIYQNDEIIVNTPENDVITEIMSKIITFDKRLNEIRMEAM